jgi:hypothetical protein
MEVGYMDRKRSDGTTELDVVLDHLESQVRDGLRHGFFEYQVTSDIVHGRKRRVVIDTGKKRQFTIREEELDE